TAFGSNGMAKNGGPLVEFSCPRELPSAICCAVITSHHPLPVASYVNQVVKMRAAWCVGFIPQPHSGPAGAFHPRPVLIARAGGLQRNEDVIVASTGNARHLRQLGARCVVAA